MSADGPGPDVMRAPPQRRCVVCQQTAGKRGLNRVVRSTEGRVRLDRTGKAAGRGAYVCGKPACLGAAGLTQRLTHSLRLRMGDIELRALATELNTLMPDPSGPAMAGSGR
ncbi:MAG: YlxR family protein [Anaerolineae bacterium]